MEKSFSKLIDGVRRFRERTVSSNREFFRQLSEGQQPLAMVITCSDSRVDPHLFLQTQPGELFVLRNAGNIVPPYSLQGGSEAATIEIAVKGLGVRHVIVCGHTHCGAMQRLMAEPALSDLPAVSAWINHAETVRRIVHARLGPGTSAEHVQAAVRENVLQQLNHLRTHPAVAEGLASHTLMLHAWLYEIDTGNVLSCEQSSGAFMPIAGDLGGDPAI